MFSVSVVRHYHTLRYMPIRWSSTAGNSRMFSQRCSPTSHWHCPV